MVEENDFFLLLSLRVRVGSINAPQVLTFSITQFSDIILKLHTLYCFCNSFLCTFLFYFFLVLEFIQMTLRRCHIQTSHILYCILSSIITYMKWHFKDAKLKEHKTIGGASVVVQRQQLARTKWLHITSQTLARTPCKAVKRSVCRSQAWQNWSLCPYKIMWASIWLHM